MEASTVTHQLVEKREYLNNTAGWLGVVKINHEGKEEGYSVEPNGTVFLSDAEAILTSRAPRRAEDNPFEEQTFLMVDPAGAKSEIRFAPLTLVGDGQARAETSDRVLPAALTAALQSTPGVVVGATATPEHVEKAAKVLGGAPDVKPGERTTVPAAVPPTTSQGTSPPPAPHPDVPHSAPVPKPRQEAAPRAPEPPASQEDGELEHREPMVVDPIAPGQVLKGNLGGEDVTPSIHTQAAPPSVGSTEEHAEVVDPAVGEETGRAKAPAGDAPAGEFAQAEEVGSPDAPDVEGFIGA